VNLAPQCVGFVVVEHLTRPGKAALDKIVSRVFVVREAAEQFAALLRKDGVDVFVREQWKVAL
jgi:hypothetical protein